MSAEQPTLPDTNALFEWAPCGLVVTTEDGRILRVNQTLCSWIGLSQVEAIGVRFQTLLTMGGRIFHQTHWAPLMQMQGSVGEIKLELLHRDGHPVTVLLNGVRRTYEGGVYHELALFGMKDRDRYERELVEARKHAEALLREKVAAEAALQQVKIELNVAWEKAQRRALFAEQMVAIASHDLKNPLTAIKMASDLLARGERSAKELQLLQNITQSSERAERMIRDLLDFAMARVGRGMSMKRGLVDLHEIVRLSLSELSVAFPHAKLTHHVYGNGLAHLDADRIQQLVGNLVANSVAYGDLRYAITLTSSIEDGLASIAVHNQGPPIPEAQIATLFEPMTRGTAGDVGARSIGLGLFIVREIASAHGGNVGVTSGHGAGTTFSITFPAADS